jgi:hypothetical protein
VKPTTRYRTLLFSSIASLGLAALEVTDSTPVTMASWGGAVWWIFIAAVFLYCAIKAKRDAERDKPKQPAAPI